MKRLLILCSSCLAALPAVGQLASGVLEYEPFADATGSGGTSYTTGANLPGQTPASYAAYIAGQAWWELGPDGATGLGVQPTIASGDLSVSGLYSAGGGHSAAFSFDGTGNSARLNLTTPAGGITSGTVYYSFALKLTDLSRLDATGTYFAGFNTVQSQNAGTGTPGTVGPRIQARSDGSGFNIGIQKGSSGAGAQWFTTTAFTTLDTLFLVGSYTFNSSSGDDVARLWVNPSSSTFGNNGLEPAADLTSTTGTDAVRLASFMLLDHAANEPSGLIDDVRIGLDWATVTPVVPEPSSLALGALGLGFLCWLRSRKSR